VFCLDGDGSVIMHMGTMASVGQRNLGNFKHIIINNGAHDSVGGQPTDAANHETFNFGVVARGCGYREVSYTLTHVAKSWVWFLSRSLTEYNIFLYICTLDI